MKDQRIISESESKEITVAGKKINILFSEYKAAEAIPASSREKNRNPENRILDVFSITSKADECISEFFSEKEIKESWINPGGWQSWAPGFEIGPKERQPSLTCFFVPQWTNYITVPGTEKEAYGNRHTVLAQFISYFRKGNKYFVMASTGNISKDRSLPPVQYVIDRNKSEVKLTVYDIGKSWKKNETLCTMAFFCVEGFFECKKIIETIFSTDRFDAIKFLGKVPGGWESWYNHYADINEALIMDDLDSLRKTENLISLSYIKDGLPCVFQIDDGWEKQLGNWEWNTERFPSPPDAITEKIAGAGFIPGLWIAPFIIDYRSPVAKNHPEWILMDWDGKPATAGFNPLWGAKKGTDQPRRNGTFFALDLSRDDVIAYLDALIDKAINEWGFRYLKLDFLYAGMLDGNFSKGGAAWQWFDRAAAVLTKRTKSRDGKPVAYLGCGMPFEHSFKYFPLSRIGCDTLEHWENIQCRRIGWNGRTSAYLNMKDTIGHALWNHTVYYADPDVIFIRKGNCSLSDDEKKLIAMTAIIFGSQIMYSDDPATSSSPEETALAKEILTMNEKYGGKEYSAVPVAKDVFRIECETENGYGIFNLSEQDYSDGMIAVKKHSFGGKLFEGRN